MALIVILCYVQKVVQVDVESGIVRSVSGEEGAWSVMCVSHDLIVAQYASPSQTPRLVGSYTSFITTYSHHINPLQMVGVVSPDMSHDITWTEICKI